MSLTDTKIRTAKAREKAYKLADEKGLFLLVKPNGSKYWRFKYRFAGKEKLLSIGVYPDVTLAGARDKRDEARKLLASDVDPGVAKQVSKRATKASAENSFEAIAREWFIKHSVKWVESHRDDIIRRLERDIFPWMGKTSISKITPLELLSILHRVESRGAIETAHRLQQTCGQVFRYAIITGRAERDPTSDLRGALQPVRKRHYASITEPKAIAGLLKSIADYQGSFITKCALQLAPLVFVRPGELRKAEWSEINFDNVEWRIPAEKMKMRCLHIVPLSIQAISILKELQPLTSNAKYLFPSARSLQRPMSENTINAALRRLGYAKEEMTAHGFRSMASTLLNEQGWNRDAIERQLAHSVNNN